GLVGADEAVMAELDEVDGIRLVFPCETHAELVGLAAGDDGVKMLLADGGGEEAADEEGAGLLPGLLVDERDVAAADIGDARTVGTGAHGKVPRDELLDDR